MLLNVDLLWQVVSISFCVFVNSLMENSTWRYSVPLIGLATAVCIIVQLATRLKIITILPLKKRSNLVVILDNQKSSFICFFYC